MHADQPVTYLGAEVRTATVTAIVVHGRNQDPAWMKSQLIDRLGRPDVAFVAPSAAEGSWYPGSFLDRLAINQPWLDSALGRIDSLITEITSFGHRRQDIVLLGFSQGACLISEYASRAGGRFGALGILTGGLIGPEGTAWSGDDLDHTPVYLGTSDVDEWVPLSRAAETARVLAEQGADVTFRVFEGMGHIINDEEVEAVRALLG
jgi:predicted esterase